MWIGARAGAVVADPAALFADDDVVTFESFVAHFSALGLLNG